MYVSQSLSLVFRAAERKQNKRAHSAVSLPSSLVASLSSSEAPVFPSPPLLQDGLPPSSSSTPNPLNETVANSSSLPTHDGRLNIDTLPVASSPSLAQTSTDKARLATPEQQARALRIYAAHMIRRERWQTGKENKRRMVEEQRRAKEAFKKRAEEEEKRRWMYFYLFCLSLADAFEDLREEYLLPSSVTVKDEEHEKRCSDSSIWFARTCTEYARELGLELSVFLLVFLFLGFLTFMSSCMISFNQYIFRLMYELLPSCVR